MISASIFDTVTVHTLHVSYSRSSSYQHELIYVSFGYGSHLPHPYKGIESYRHGIRKLYVGAEGH